MVRPRSDNIMAENIHKEVESPLKMERTNLIK